MSTWDTWRFHVLSCLDLRHTLAAEVGGLENMVHFESSEVLFSCSAHSASENWTRDWLVRGVEWIHDAFHPCFVNLFEPRPDTLAWGVFCILLKW